MSRPAANAQTVMAGLVPAMTKEGAERFACLPPRVGGRT